MPKRTKTSIYLDPPDLKRLKELAKKKDLTVAQMIRQAIRKILQDS
jgi:predicted transcriptional regulator